MSQDFFFFFLHAYRMNKPAIILHLASVFPVSANLDVLLRGTHSPCSSLFWCVFGTCFVSALLPSDRKPNPRQSTGDKWSSLSPSLRQTAGHGYSRSTDCSRAVRSWLWSPNRRVAPNDLLQTTGNCTQSFSILSSHSIMTEKNFLGLQISLYVLSD